MEIKLNNEQRLYVIPCGGGYTCLGYDVCFDDATQVANAIGRQADAPTEAMRGTLDCYELHGRLWAEYSKHPVSKRTWYRAGTPAKVRSIIEAARKSRQEEGNSGQILRIFYGDPATGHDWISEYDTIGFIGRTSGSRKEPLILEPLRSEYGGVESARGGDIIMTDRILRIIDVRGGEELYRAKNYQLPAFMVGEASAELKAKGYVATVSRDAVVQANFKEHESAMEYVAFLQGFKIHRAFRTHREYAKDFEEA
jgi:hypothetical protein